MSDNAVCLKCGSTQENPETAFCINDHDDWLESNDEMERFEIASKRFGVPIKEIVSSIKNGIDLVVVLEWPLTVGALRSWGFKAQMFIKALLLIRITKVGVKHFRPNFLKPLLSASAVLKVGSFKF